MRVLWSLHVSNLLMFNAAAIFDDYVQKSVTIIFIRSHLMFQNMKTSQVYHW